MSLYGKQKIWFLIDRLIDEREVTEANQPIALHPMDDLNGHYAKMDFIQLTEKLEKEHKAIKLLNSVPTDQTYGKYLIELLPDFEKYVQELRKDPDYLEWKGEKPKPEPVKKTEPISVSHARKNGVMTGTDKIQAVIEEINNKYQGLVSGNVVILHSGNLGQRGLEMHEQKQVLDKLSKDRKVIKYTAMNEYKDRSEIHPRDQVDVFEGSMDQLEADEMFEQILEQQLYTIEVLPAFTKLADDLLGDAEIERNKDIYLLKLLYSRVISILDGIVAEDIAIEDDQLDGIYIQITALLENVLNKPSMQDWKDNAPTLFETLLGQAAEIGKDWHSKRPKVLKFYAKIHKDWTLNGKQDFELSDELLTMLEDVYRHIGAYRKIVSRISEDMQKHDTEKIKNNLQDFVSKEPADSTPEDTDKSSQNEKAEVRSLQPSSYHDKTGKLNISPTVDIAIAKRGKVKRKDGTKYNQCHLMSCLFKNVNTLKNGITFSTFLGVKYDKNSRKHIRKIRNTIDEINEKIADKTTAKKLILPPQGERIYVDKSYL